MRFQEDTMERSIEVFAVIQLALVGLSHLLRPGDWVDFFVWLRGRGHAGAFVHGLMTLGFASLVVAFHNVWSGIPAVLTATAWLYLVKASLCLLLPETQLVTLGRVSHERAWELRLAGAVQLTIAGLLAYSLWWA
ncbi:MAG: hypothetical protein ACRCT8_14590 [Lacipirellulaceae bacterium]